jgi:hypothetical protein
MSALESEFFDLLATSQSRWTTLLIEGRTWTNIHLRNLAWQAQIDREKANGAHVAILQRPDSDDGTADQNEVEAELEQHEEIWSLWVTPERRRAKFQVGDGTVDVVIEGSTFWSNGFGRSFTNGGKNNYGHGEGDGQNLIRTTEYCGLLHVVELSRGLRIGRDTIDAKVTIREDDDPERGQGVHGLTIGDADALELSIDRERGVVLSASSWMRGAIYRIVEITKVEFDPHFGLDTFKIEPVFGTEWSSV